MSEHRFSLPPFPLQKEEGQGGKKFGQEGGRADSLVAAPPTQATLHRLDRLPQAEALPAFAATSCRPRVGRRGANPDHRPPRAIMPRLISPRKLTLGSRLDVKLLWIEMIRRVGSGLLPALQNRSRHKRTILQEARAREGGGCKIYLQAVIINQHHAGTHFLPRQALSQ